MFKIKGVPCQIQLGIDTFIFYTETDLTKSSVGVNNPMYGKKNPATSERNKLRTKETMPSDYVWASSVAVLQYTKEMELITKFNSVREAAKSVSRTEGAISMCITGRNRTCAGYIWVKAS